MGDNNSEKKKLRFEYKTNHCDSKVIESIDTVRNKILISMAYKTIENNEKLKTG